VAELGEVVWVVDVNRQSLDQAYLAVDDTRPTVIFAYTIKVLALAGPTDPGSTVADRGGFAVADRWATTS
jgi:pyruvate dehydrogenase complex dehydrogenase (E1) component